ncbi:MAG: hypothetical protein OEZ10_09030 [Gammaproteobacteria bacterium]|nr:hypothetical protein [Gammaproteobacteria bacterium]
MIAALLISVLCIISGVVCHRLAAARGRQSVPWGVAGLMFGPLVIPIILLLPRRR